jgi:redox-regulated HSP33 family molecular chaperone
MGERELRSLLDDQPLTELVCHFCNRHETFTSDELEALLARALGRLQ